MILIIMIIVIRNSHFLFKITLSHQDHFGHLGHHDHDHDYLCKADGTAVVGVKGNSQLVIVPQGVRCALGLKPR